MRFHLIGHRDNCGRGQQLLDIGFSKVGDAYRLDQTGLQTVLQSLVRLDVVGVTRQYLAVGTFREERVVRLSEAHGPVDQTQVQVRRLELVQDLLDALHYPISLEVSQPYFGHEE